jgi:hypothetical protein
MIFNLEKGCLDLSPQLAKFTIDFRVVSHIPKFGDASKSSAGDTVSPAGDAASPSGDAVVSYWRCIISFRDAHPSHSHPHLLQETPDLPREMCSHLQVAGYVTLLRFSFSVEASPRLLLSEITEFEQTLVDG